ncbi:MAG: TIM barrel protein [archaeon]
MDYKIIDYQGGYSSLDPEKSYGSVFVNYHTAAKKLGMSTDPRTANVLKEVSEHLSSGVQTIEMSPISPDVFESIPKQHLKEVKELAKLTGADITLHAPIVEASGVTEQGWSEMNRARAEKQMEFAVKRAHEINPEKSSPVTFHSSAGIPGTEYKIVDGKFAPQKLIVINRETGKMAPLEEEKKYYPDMRRLKEGITREEKEKYYLGEISEEKIFEKVPLETGKIITPEKRAEILNSTEWDNSISQLIFNKERADEILTQNQVQIQHLIKDMDKINPENLKPTQKQAWLHLQTAQSYLEDTYQHAGALFSKAYEYGSEEQKKHLRKISERFQKNLEKNPSVTNQSEAIHMLLVDLKEQNISPKMWVPIEQFAVEKSSETFANIALKSYKEFKNEAPIISIENPPAGGGLSTGEDLRKLVEESRRKFIEKARTEGISESEAKKQAEKLIGVTWDVGHINMMRGMGFEEKDIIKESEKIAPFLKHVHLSDNFGLQHTELPMGMGNVPIKEIMEKLGEKGFEAKKIIEAGNWWQPFSPGGKQGSPFKSTLLAMGSPIYSMEMTPYWNQSIGLQQGYFGGYGMMLPQKNYQMFGAGFSQLPAELGGQIQGGGSRMGGTPME